MSYVRSVNVGRPRPIAAKSGRSGIDKRPADGPVLVRVPGDGASGLAGDTICDVKHHGGPDQAVYAYAREDLDHWQAELGRELPDGSFGENLTTAGIDVTGARIGERWRVGAELELEVSVPRVPCRTFAVWLAERGWIRTFAAAGLPGTYLRVLRPGTVRAGDPVTVLSTPPHDVTVGLVFRALLTEPELLPRLLDAPQLPDEVHDLARRRTGIALDSDG